MTRPPLRLARPTFGSAASGGPPSAPIASIAASAACRPAPWFAPIAASPSGRRRAAASAAVTPASVSAPSSKVSVATVGLLRKELGALRRRHGQVAERADRAGDEDVAARHLARLPRQLHARAVDSL